MLHAFTIKNQTKVRVLRTSVKISLPYSKEELKEKNSLLKDYFAIWDTGATGCVITKKVVDELGLKPVGITEMQHAGGRSTTNIYLVNIYLPNGIIIPHVKVSEAILTNDGIPENYHSNVLIGMNVINLGSFAVSNVNDKTTLSFQVPSSFEIDFVPDAKEHNVMEGGNRHERKAFEAKKRKGRI